jgi:phosphatidate phosphatase PAH1
MIVGLGLAAWIVGTGLATTAAQVGGADPCPPHPWVEAPGSGFRHRRSRAVAALGEPAHVAQKFAYGLLSKDLEDEPVRVFLDTCDGWKAVAEATTDDDGRVSVALDPRLAPGVHRLRFVVSGDGSSAEAAVWMKPRGTRLAVFDIDGTLTVSDREVVKDVEADLFRPLLTGDYVPRVYPGAADLTRALTEKGYVLLYLTGRPYWLARRTREWLAEAGFAPGVLRLTDRTRDFLPDRRGVGEFKRRYLASLAAAGFVLELAHGNAPTDVYAYLRAGIPPQAVYIIGRHGGVDSTGDVGSSWEARVREVRELPPVRQP